jgi:hypothetical protein
MKRLGSTKKQDHPSENPLRDMEGVGPHGVHTSADSPGLPNLAGAQNPGPGTSHIFYGEDGRLPDEAAGPRELQGHLGADGWLRRLFRRRSVR